MKHILIILLLSSCASANKSEVRECIAAQVDTYGDLCFESSVGYEDMNGTDAYTEGLKCATEAALNCLGDL